MTREELIHKWNSYKGIIIYPTDNVKELINATIEELEKEPCEDCISRQVAIKNVAQIAKVAAKSDKQKSLCGRIIFMLEHMSEVSE